MLGACGITVTRDYGIVESRVQLPPGPYQSVVNYSYVN